MEKLNQLPSDTADTPESVPATGNSRIKLLVRLVADTKETYTPSDPKWLTQAECNTAGIASSDFFETEINHPLAKEVCGRCSIALPCLRYALDNNEKGGVWGGADARERRAIRAKLIQHKSSSA